MPVAGVSFGWLGLGEGGPSLFDQRKKKKSVKRIPCTTQHKKTRTPQTTEWELCLNIQIENDWVCISGPSHNPSIMIIACKHALSTLPSSQESLPMRYNQYVVPLKISSDT